MKREEFTKKYGKILLPLVTPYDANEEIDYGKYEELIEYLIKNDLCDSFIVTGTTGEASLLRFEERVKLMETAVKAAAGRKPVIAGTGCASTKRDHRPYKRGRKAGDRSVHGGLPPSTTSLLSRVYITTIRLWPRVLP